MRIGELAAATGLTTKTIRFYEGEGLLPEPGRTTSGYRVYGETDSKRLDFVLKAKRLGLSLEEIKGVLQLHDRKEPTCVHVRSLLEEKLSQVEKAIAELQEFRAELFTLRDQAGGLVDCRPLGGDICGIIEGSAPADGEIALGWIDERRVGKARVIGGGGKNP
jgi:DNA-binding transcriptional MerR regulator